MNNFETCRPSKIRYFMIFWIFGIAQASNGDSSHHFQECLKMCEEKKCSIIGKFEKKQPLYLRLIGWDCKEECKYRCMWRTVDVIKNNNNKVPQFYGKWPFVRVMGTQELISSLASLLNLMPHAFMFRKIWKIFNRYHPMSYWYGLSLFCSLVNVNAWFWSFVFHTKDTPLTERLDYFCAFSVVLTSAFVSIARVSLGNKFVVICAMLTSYIFFFYHICYMLFINFDYGYNMKVNVALGICVIVTWVLWFIKARGEQPYAIKMLICCISFMLVSSLELFDFPPIFWLFDAHSLWHIGTVPLSFLMYSFIDDDMHYLKKRLYDNHHIA